MSRNNGLLDLVERVCIAIESVATKYTEPTPKGKHVTGPFETREQLRAEVFLLHKKGYTGKRIAKHFGISSPTVSRILRGDKKQDNGY
jgi:DNA invertase Pin-like site-specific DNA recombinase